MIDLVHLEYKDNYDLDWKITKYANENLKEMIHFAWDDITETGDIEFYSPPRLVIQSRDECILRIRELWRFSQDHILRKDLSPVYQYHLYKIINYYIEIFSETGEGSVPFDEPIIINEMDADLKEQAVAHYGDTAIGRFSDVQSYLGEFFDDLDFLPDFLAGAVQLYLDKSPLFYFLTSIEELEQYVELMDGDTYRKYQAICVQRQTNNEQQEDRHPVFDKDLKTSLHSIQGNPQYWNLDENSLNDRLRDLLRMKYHVVDQTRQGVSLSQKSAGEIDFLVSEEDGPIAIMEALILDSVDKGYIQDHLNKLIVNYDPQGYPHACLIMYVTCKNFGTFWNNFTNYISEYDFPYPVEQCFREGHSSFSESRNAYMLLMRSNQPALLSFHAIHLREKGICGRFADDTRSGCTV